MNQLPFFRKGLLLLCLFSSTIILAQIASSSTVATAPIVDPVDPIDPISISTAYATQINATFQHLDKTRIPHKLLVDYAMEFKDLAGYNGTLTPQNILHRGHYTSIYNTLLMSRVTTTVQRLINPDLFRNNWDNLRVANKIVLSGLYYKYNQFKPNAPTNTITITNGKLYDKFVNGVWQNPYDEKQVFAMAAPILKFNRLNMQVQLPASLWYTNQASSVSNIAIDFSDGSGYQIVTLGQIKNVAYSTAGVKEWKYRLTLYNNQILYSHSKIQIDAEIAPVGPMLRRTINQPCTVNGFGIDEVEFTGVRPYNSKVAKAILEIDYAGTPGCGTITKPLIVVEGFDSGILGVENVLGENDYSDFIQEATNNTGNLPDQLITYDIIYINFTNSRDYLQRNAYLVEDIIKWVNSVKVGNIPNVVLGQSMGGIIARYALKDMENQQALNPSVPTWQHKTSLYVSHDAPHQGANVPLAIQFFSRHIINQFVSTPLGDFNINISGDGAPVTISDLQKLLNAPGTKQLLNTYVNSGFTYTNPIGDAWKTELRNLGYPVQTRNIAISNSNHCGNQQGFQPLDNLFTFSGNGQTGILTDFLLFLSPLANTVTSVGLAILLGEPGLLVGILPGNSKFALDFYGKALPTSGSTNQIYHGNISFTKTLFSLFGWTPRITVNLTNRDYYAPGGLSFDYFPGGRYKSFLTNGSSTSDPDFSILGNFGIQFTARDTFNFIPAPSALDIGSGYTVLNDSDYFRKYNSVTPPIGAKSSPFVNFITAYTEGSNQNEIHISFNARNGNWLATALDNNTPNQVFDCTFICNNTQIIGAFNLCTTSTYSLPISNASITWSVTPANIVSIIAGQGTNQVTLSSIGNNQAFTLNAVVTTNACGTSAPFSRSLRSGRPETPLTISGPSLVITGTLVNYFAGSSEGADEYEWWLPYPYDTVDFFDYFGTNWAKTNTSNGSTVQLFTGTGQNAGLVQVMGKNICGCGGARYISVTHGTGGSGGIARLSNSSNNIDNDYNSFYKIYPNPTANILNVDLKNQDLKPTKNAIIKAELYNMMGEVKRNISISNNIASIDVSGLLRGIYLLKINIDGTIESHQIAIE